MSAVTGLAILLYNFYIAQTQKIAAYLDAQGVRNWKRQLYTEKKVCWAKNIEKLGLYGVFRSAQKRLGVLL